MTWLRIEGDTDNMAEETIAWAVDGWERQSVRISNDAAENGYDQNPGPLTWLNSARITTDPNDDAVHVVVSIGDPRGGFCFTIRRRPDTGHILLHLPHPGESMPHMNTVEDHAGTLVVVGHEGEPLDFSDDEGDDDETETE